MAMPGLSGGSWTGIPARTMHLMGGDREMQRTREREPQRASSPLINMITPSRRYADSTFGIEGVGVT
ncbi:hypothetical protein SZN_36679 [Streptomyces zinciresistens K42]|uniref:Uncharacterized protein n=1 Tax=Streptomyces zinciresistens K42 TaxID=700597 RepID=G2GP78_9ACTN|nr:hypothetical protein SZN_36679 [Streptomyces zinciresistens K42]